MNVVAGGAQVATAAALYQLRLRAPAQNVTRELVAVVEADRIGALQPSHAGDQIGVGGFEDKMIVVAHQAIGMRLPAGPLAGLSQRLYEVMPIHVIEENVVALIATAHDVIHRSGILHSKLARHGRFMGAMPLIVNLKCRAFLRSDPIDGY
jgi:hypothetical protein